MNTYKDVRSRQAGEAEAWCAHLADYALTPLFDQTGAPAGLPTASQFRADALIPQSPLANHSAAVRRALARSGYSQGWSEGLYTDRWHDCFLPFEQLTLRIKHSYCIEGSTDDVEIESAAVYAGGTGQALDCAGLPKPLLATLMGQLEKIRTAPAEPDESEAPVAGTRRGGGFLLVEFSFDTDSEDFDALVEALSQAKHNGDRAADAYLAEVLAKQAASVRSATQGRPPTRFISIAVVDAYIDRSALTIFMPLSGLAEAILTPIAQVVLQPIGEALVHLLGYLTGLAVVPIATLGRVVVERPADDDTLSA